MKQILIYGIGLWIISSWGYAEDNEPRLDDPKPPPRALLVEPNSLPPPPKALLVDPESETAPLSDLSGSGDRQRNGQTRFGNITVVGSRQVVRGSIASIVQGIRAELNKLTLESDRDLKLPIIIRLYGEEGEEEKRQSIVSEIVELEGRYQLLLHLHLAKGVDREKLRYHAMELLLYERGLSEGQRVVEGERVLVSPWIIVGMLEVIDIKAGREDKKIYQSEFPHFEVISLVRVFDTSESQWKRMSGRQPTAFRAISGAMVSSLLRQPDGRFSMSKFLASVATYKGEMENLMRQHFPGMNKSQNSLTKWVDLEMAELGTANTSDVHSILETEKRLDSILILRYRDELKNTLTVGIDGYREILKLKGTSERLEAVSGARAELERLSYRCFPVYRPLIIEYETILRELVQGEDRQIRVRLDNLSNTRMIFIRAGKQVRDYLDWYYITQSKEVGGDFKSYIELSEALKRESMRPNEKDAIQLYLNQVEELFLGKGQELKRR